MHIHCSLLFAALTISWLGPASCLSNSSYDLLSGRQIKSCPSDGTPVCGLQDKQLVLFSNDCLFDAANRNVLTGETTFRKIPLQNCMQACNFSCLKTYKPVCARNKKTLRKHLFRNQCELSKNICKKNTDYLKINLYECKTKVRPKKINKALVKRDEEPRRRRPVLCTNVFKPVCGSYLGVKSSFKNECILNAENVALNRDWRIIKYGMCPEDLSKNRRRKDKPAKTHSIKKRSYSNNVKDYSSLSQLAAYIDNSLNVSPNDVYIYEPSNFQNEFLNHGSKNYHHALTENKVYDECLEKIAPSPPFDMSFAQSQATIEEADALSSEKTIIRPVPFSLSRKHFNYMSNKNLAHEINRHTSVPAVEPINDETQKQIYYAFKAGFKNEYLNRMPTTLHAPVQTVQTSEGNATTTVTPKSTNKQKQIKREEIARPKVECKFGEIAICATLTNGTLRTFETLCDMMTANNYLENTWTKLHEGSCDDCKYNCTREYTPVCVSKNSVNYTMINECYYNMGICLDKKSKWKLLSYKECDRYTRVPDKHSESKPGFAYTSNYYVAETTEKATGNTTLQTTSSKPLKTKSMKHKKHKGNVKRETGTQSADKCCSRSNLQKQSSQDIRKCKCWNDTLQEPPTFHESQTESHIMSLIRDKGTTVDII